MTPLALNADSRIAVIGLGYVGLPLAVEFAKHRPVLGFDIDTERVRRLTTGEDVTGEVSTEGLTASTAEFSCDPSQLADCDVFIVTVPTPVNQNKQPDLTPLQKASETVARALRPGGLVIYESTVYPGVTEEECVPVLERVSGLRFNSDFYCGYSPERINPGDKNRHLVDILKITSGSTPEVADAVDALYQEIIRAGTYKAESMKVAEAAKEIENTQRDLNISLVNELALIFSRLGIDTEQVLNAAGTKWNFLPFRPGLVGGHCIGVDPYYLASKAEAVGYHPAVILAGRRVNDGMGAHVAGELVKAMLKNDVRVNRSRVLVMGLAFKENCPDTRNTRIVDVLKSLSDYSVQVDVFDPWVHSDDAAELGVSLIDAPEPGAYDGIIVAVAHDQFKALGIDGIEALGTQRCVIYDLKYILPPERVHIRL